ncbi:MAG: DUF488 domain-containing protein [Thiohalomonadaceae bacterium]
MRQHIDVKRVYDPSAKSDGARVLVDRVWPRGVRKEELALDAWEKDVAPSPALRTWFGHDPARWEEFRRRYFAELDRRPEALARLRALARRGRLTLLFSARDTEHNNAVALRDYLMSGGETRTRRPQSARTDRPRSGA